MSDGSDGGSSPALLFVPDISGFTEFVKDTEIAHSRHIIEELLEKLIEADDIGLTVSEIEGDAVLFYRFGDPPAAEDFFRQVRKMFVALHTHLKLYETQRICQCGACASAPELTLKIVAHHGPIMQSTIKGHEKLFGQDVITVHRLLKNAVPSHEYALFTEQLARAWTQSAAPPWADCRQGSEEYDVGRVEYSYVELAPLQQEVPEPRVEDFSIQGVTVPVFSCEQLVDAPMELVFEIASDLPRRLSWMEGAKDIEMLNDSFNRLGTKHRCVVDKNSPVMVTSGSTRDADTITFTETDEKKQMCSVYVLERAGDARTRVRINGFLKDSLPLRVIFSLLLKKKLMSWFQASSENLKQLCEELYAHQQPDRGKSAQPR